MAYAHKQESTDLNIKEKDGQWVACDQKEQIVSSAPDYITLIAQLNTLKFAQRNTKK